MADTKLLFRKLKWTSEQLTLAQFLDKYSLPQIVKVTEGFRSEFDDAVLFLQSVKTIQKVHGRLGCGKGRQISIPLNCESKVEVRSSHLKDVYESVEELCSAFPPYVRVARGFHNESSGGLILSVGDKLHLKGIDKCKKKHKKLVCFNQNGKKVTLSKDCAAAFQPLTDGNEYYLSDVLTKFKMPVKVHFVEPYYSIGEDRSGTKPNCEPFQTICLERISTIPAVTGTLIYADGSYVTVQFSREVNVKLVACEDTFRKSAEYAKICKIFNQDINSEDIYTQPHEYIHEAAIQFESTAIKPSPKQPKPVAHPKSKSGNPTAVQHESIPIYETVDIDEEKGKDSTYTAFNPTNVSHQQYESSVVEQLKPRLPKKAIALPIKWASKVPDSTNTALNPTHISNQYEKPVSAEKPTPRSRNQPKTLDKPRLPKKAITLPKTRLPPSSVPPIPKKSEVSNSKSDRALNRAERSKSTDTLPQNPYSIPKDPDNPPNAHSSPSVVTSKIEKEKSHHAIAKCPLDLSGLNVVDVGMLLINLGMEKYVEIFANEMIDGSMLASLDEASLKSLDVCPFHVIKLLKFIGGWRPNLSRSSKY